MERFLPYDEKKAIVALTGVSTATITTILLKSGLRNVWLRRSFPLLIGQGRKIGRAFTLRFIPAREDLATPASWSSPTSTRAAIEAMHSGAIVVADAMSNSDAGIVGDILCARMLKKGIEALVTDGAIRDRQGVLATGLPIWAAGVAAPPAVGCLTFVGWQEPIGCGGVAIYPDDLIVCDDDGAVVIPANYVERVLDQATEQECLEDWIMQEVERGRPLPGLYPPDEDNYARYKALKKRLTEHIKVTPKR